MYSFTAVSRLGAHQNIDHPVKIVEEREEVECKFAPALLLTVCQNICVHYCSGIIQTRSTHNRTAHIPPDVIGQQGYIESKRQPFSSAQEHNAEENMDEVLRQDERV